MTLATLQIVTPVVIVTFSLLFILLERLFPYNRGEKVFREGFWVDLIGYGLVQSYLLGLIISEFIYTLDQWSGASRFRLVGDWPIWVQVIFFIVTHDLVTFLIHRWQHRSKWLWPVHEAHHSCYHVDWLSGIRSHSLEILLYQSAEFIPVILLGASPEVPLYKAMANSVYGMYIHSNLNIRMGALLYVFNGPELHRWHHARSDERAFDKNFATKFSCWDYLSGTIFNPKDSRAHDYGPEKENYPRGYIGQHLYAVRRWLGAH